MGQTITIAAERKGKHVKNPIWEGWIKKAGVVNKSWKDRYFYLEDGRLYYFRSETSKHSKGYIPLEDATGVCVLPHRPQLEKHHIGHLPIVLCTRARIWMLALSSEEELNEFIQTLTHNSMPSTSIEEVEVVIESWVCIEKTKSNKKRWKDSHRKRRKKNSLTNSSSSSLPIRRFAMYVGCGEILFFVDGSTTELSDRIQIVEILHLNCLSSLNDESQRLQDVKNADKEWIETSSLLPIDSQQNQNSSSYQSTFEIQLILLDGTNIWLTFDSLNEYDRWKFILNSAIEDQDVRGLTYLRSQRRQQEQNERRQREQLERRRKQQRRNARHRKRNRATHSNAYTSASSAAEDTTGSIVSSIFSEDDTQSIQTSDSRKEDRRRRRKHRPHRSRKSNPKEKTLQDKDSSSTGSTTASLPSEDENGNPIIELGRISENNQLMDRASLKGCRLSKTGKILRPLFTPPSSPSSLSIADPIETKNLVQNFDDKKESRRLKDKKKQKKIKESNGLNIWEEGEEEIEKVDGHPLENKYKNEDNSLSKDSNAAIDSDFPFTTDLRHSITSNIKHTDDWSEWSIRESITSLDEEREKLYFEEQRKKQPLWSWRRYRSSRKEREKEKEKKRWGSRSRSSSHSHSRVRSRSRSSEPFDNDEYSGLVEMQTFDSFQKNTNQPDNSFQLKEKQRKNSKNNIDLWTKMTREGDWVTFEPMINGPRVRHWIHIDEFNKQIANQKTRVSLGYVDSPNLPSFSSFDILENDNPPPPPSTSNF